MTEHIKVGLDQWVTADARTTELMTDGLNGCVALGLAGNGKISLAHVYSDCNKDSQWEKYLPKLEASLEAAGLGDLHGKKAVLVCSQGQGAGKFANASGSDDPSVKSSQYYLPDKLKVWLESKGMVVESRQDAGCSISTADGAIACALKKDSSADRFRYDYSTTVDPVVGVAHQGLSKDAAPAGESHAPPGTKLLSDTTHPVHALYDDILGKIPREAVFVKPDKEVRASTFAQQAAGALTLECLRQGITSIDSVAAGRSQEGDSMLFAVKGTQAESMRHVAVNMDDGQVSDRPLAKYSELASKQHETLAVAQANVPAQTQTVAATHVM